MDSVQQETDFNITFTKVALEEMKKYADEDNVQYFRISVMPGGCSGFKYNFTMEKGSEQDDIILEQDNGLKVLIDPFSSMHLNGTSVNYKKTMMEAGFVFQNPNASARCGCGSSFSA